MHGAMGVSEHSFFFPSNVPVLNGFNIYVSMCLTMILGSIIISTCGTEHSLAKCFKGGPVAVVQMC